MIAARNEAKTTEAMRDIKEKFGVRVLGLKVDVSQEVSIQAGLTQQYQKSSKAWWTGIVFSHKPEPFMSPASPQH